MKKLILFGLVFILLMVGFVNASFNTVNFTTTEYDTNETLDNVSYYFDNSTFTTTGTTIYGADFGGFSFNNPASFFDGNEATDANHAFGDTPIYAYLGKNFTSGEFISSVHINVSHYANFDSSSKGFIYIDLYIKNSSNEWHIERNLANTEITTLGGFETPTFDDNIILNQEIYGIYVLMGYNYTAGSALDIESMEFYELSFVTHDEITPLPYTFSNGTEEIFASKENYYGVSNNITFPYANNTYNFYEMYNSLLTITATDNSTGSPINTFNASIELTNGSTVSYGTTSGSVEIPVIDGETYNITVSSDSAQYVTNTDEVSVSGFTDSYDFNIYTFNSVRINIYDGLTSTLMSQSVTIQTISEGEQSVGSVYWPALYGDIVSFENVTSTGTILIDFLAPADYELRFISDGYNTVSKFVSITNDSTQIVNTYMILNNDSDSQKVHVTNTGTPLDTNYAGAVVRLQQENIGGDSLYITIQEYKTNILGNANVWVVRDASTFYRFQVIGDNRTLLTTTKIAFLPDVEETIELIVDTTESSRSIFDDDGSVTYTTVWSGVNNETFTFDWSDASSTIVGGRLLVTGQYLNVSLEEQTISDVSFVGDSGTLQYTLPVLNETKYTVYAFITYSNGEKLVYSVPIVFHSDVLVDSNNGILIAFFVFIITIFATYLLGPLWSGIIGFSSLMLLTMLNIIILPITIITSFIAFFILLFIKIRRGQQ